MKRLSILIIVLLSALFLGLLTPFILNPSFDAINTKSSDLYHKNPAQSLDYSYLQSGYIQSLMQELLDAPWGIANNIQIRNIEEAKREFEVYNEKTQYFNEIVIKLDLNESVIGDFRMRNLENLKTLEQIINKSEQFDEINRLEIQYQSEKNLAPLLSVSKEGDAIYNALNKAIIKFIGSEPVVIDISSQLNLSTIRFREANSILKEVITEDRIRQEERISNLPELSHSFSLSISPKSGQYGDTLWVAGLSPVSSLSEIILLLDGNYWKTLQPDSRGVFSTPLQIGRIRGGKHAIFATSKGTIHSDFVDFSVIPAETVLTLETIPGDHWSEIFCSGELYAGEIPITDAPVRIIVDDFEILTIETNQTGFYEASLDLTQGNHTILAIFDEADFPLSPSESGIQTVTIKSLAPTLLAISVGAGFVLLGLIGGIWYLRWKKETLEVPPQEPPESPSYPLIPPDIPIQYDDLNDLGEIWYLSGTEGITLEPEQSSSLPPPADSDVWKKGESASPAQELPETGEGILERSNSYFLPYDPKDILIRYQDLFESGKLNEAAVLLYQSLIRWLVSLHGVSEPSTMTPREFVALLSATSIGVPFQSFIARYEEIWYGGLLLRHEDTLLSNWKEVIAIFEVEMDSTKGEDR